MKKRILFSCILLFLFFLNLQTQLCNLTVSGGNCTGEELTATTSNGFYSKLTWLRYGSPVYNADTISSSASISAVAGNHGNGSASNQFGFPAGGIALDAVGNIYVADYSNNRVQKWVPGAASGITVAGGNGVGSNANQLYYPKDVFVDTKGNVYVADFGNARIQKWIPGSTSGITVAGGNGAGSSANQFHGPNGVYVDAAGNIFVSDCYNARIQKWSPGGTQGVTVAGGNGYGTGANQFRFPIDVYLDGTSNIYIADADVENSDYHRVQKWASGATSGITVAGGNGTGAGANQFGYLLAITVDAAGNVYAADNGVSGTPVGRIQKWAVGAASGVTVAGGHHQGWDVLIYPSGVALDNSGNIYAIDGTYNPRVQKYIPTNGEVNNKYTPAISGSYTVEAVFKNGCVATSNPVFISSTPVQPDLRAITRDGRGNLCKGGTHMFFINNPEDDADYSWIIPAECSLVADKGDSIIISVPQGFSLGNLIVTASNICGSSAPDTLLLQGKPVKPFRIKGPLSVYPNQANVMYSVADYGNTYYWRVPEGVTIVSGQFTAAITVNWGIASGTISVNAANRCGASAKQELYVSLRSTSLTTQQQKPTSNTTSVTRQIIISPNPTRDIASLIITADKKSKYVIEVKDISGKTLLYKETSLLEGINKINLDVSNYATGMYLVCITNSLQEKVSLMFSKQ